MGLNESKGNMYSWVTHTWNTIKGECPHGCIYCYMKRWGKQKSPYFDRTELKTDLGKDNFIFVGSSCDLFADKFPEIWILETLNHCRKFDNTYLFQSKNPLAMVGSVIMMPPKSLVCTTIETNRFYKDKMGETPLPESRARSLAISTLNRFVTIEPIMDFDVDEFVELIKICEPTQVSIGADSGNNNLPEPTADKLRTLIYRLSKITKIDQKKNLKRILDAAN